MVHASTTGSWFPFGLSIYFFCHLTDAFSVEILSPGNKNFATIGSMPVTAPGLDMGLEELQRNYFGVVNYTLTYLYNKSLTLCDDLAGVMDDIVGNYYCQKRLPTDLTVAVFPGCSREAISATILLTGWNELVILTATNDASFRNKANYPNVIQASPILANQIALVYKLFMRHMKWKTVYIIYDKGGPYSAMGGTVSQAVLKTFQTTRGITPYYAALNTFKNETFGSILEDVRSVARVVSLWCHADTVRAFMLEAAKAGMTDGTYVYIAYAPFFHPTQGYGNITWQHDDSYDEAAFSAYRSLFVIVPSPTSEEADQTRAGMSADLRKRSLVDYKYAYKPKEEPTELVYTLYASMHILGQVIYEYLLSNPSVKPTSSGFLARKFWNSTFKTPVGEYSYDDTGQGTWRYDVRQLNGKTGAYEAVMQTALGLAGMEELSSLKWWAGDDMPPDVPICGFAGNTGPCADGIENRKKERIRIAAGVAVGVFLAAVILGLFSRYMVDRAHRRPLSWRLENVEFSEKVDLTEKGFLYPPHIAGDRSGLPVTLTAFTSADSIFAAGRSFQRLYSEVATLQHHNIAQLLGISIFQERLMFVAERCQRGDLHELLHHAKTAVDRDIKQGFIADLLQGAKVIHSMTYVKCHGLLSCSTCAIDNHFTLKITDLAVQQMLQKASYAPKRTDSSAPLPKNLQLHIAPEVQADGDIRHCTPRCDIYAIATLTAEIVSDSAAHMQPNNVFDGFESRVQDILPNKNSLLLLRQCLEGNPVKRPTLKAILATQQNSMTQKSAIERILRRVEKHAEDLESAVEARTQDLLVERRKCDELLLHMLPAHIVESLRRLKPVLPESFDVVTLLFSDIVGFVEFVNATTPFDVIQFLNKETSLLDNTITEFDVYKVETIGDSYLLASGLPNRNGDRHGRAICLTACKMQQDFLSSGVGRNVMHLRIGCHTGPVVTSVIGLKRPRYCLFGDTVNTASRMESHGEASKIHLSPTTAKMVKDAEDLQCVPRGEITVKGKGLIETFWLSWDQPSEN